MQNRVPKLINSLRFCESGRHLEGKIQLHEFERLYDMLAPSMQREIADTQPEAGSDSLSLQLNLDFDIDDFNHYHVCGKLQTGLVLTCLRCMEDMPFQVDIDLAIAFLRHRDEEQEIEGMYEGIEIDEKDSFDLYGLIEDEIILSLPLIAKHQHDCLQYDADKLDEIELSYRRAMQEKENPFAVLARLKH